MTEVTDPIDKETDDWRSCIVTPEQRLERLLGLELKLAERFRLKGPPEVIRYRLIAMDARGDLVEDELVADWQGELSAYIQELLWKHR